MVPRGDGRKRGNGSRVSCQLSMKNRSARMLFKYVLGHRHRREHVRPASVEGEMRQDFRNLGLCQSVIHADGDVAGKLSNLAGCDKGTDGN